MFGCNLFLRQKRALARFAIGSGVGNYRSRIAANRSRIGCLGIRHNRAQARSIGSRRFINFGRGSRSNLRFSN